MNKLVSPKIAKLLKEKGFEVPVPHCYTHNDWSNDSYSLELFSFYLNKYNGTTSSAYDEAKLMQGWFDPDGVSNTGPLNESDVFFNYNQDIRRLLVSRFNGKEYMDDEKCLNFYVDSITYNSWSNEEIEDNKVLMPNYNDGDFEWSIYCDVISAPSISAVVMWIYEKYKVWISVKQGFGWEFYISVQNGTLNKDGTFNSPTEAYEAAIEFCLTGK